MKYIYRFTPEILVVLYLFLFLGLKSPERSWDRIINSDGKGYYAYLPAVFIYHDLEFKFVEQYEYQYYPSNKAAFKEFRNEIDGQRVNKYFPGLALVWLPFFLFGHAMAWLEVFPRDGYSMPYQYAIALSALLFLWMGCRWTMKLLQKFKSDERTAAFLTFVIALGTNLPFFTIVEPSMTHVYSFALIAGFSLFAYKFFHEYHPKWFVKSCVLLTLITLIRPTNALIILLIPFLAGDRETFTGSFRRVAADRWALIRGIVQVTILLLVPVILWYLQTGKFIVYTYGSEKLHLLKPHFFSILFSFNRGWFLYTPVAFLSIFGLIGVFRENRLRFYWLTGFLLIFIYVASCWWVWNYASKCGQRVFIDLYVVIALLLLFLLRSIPKKILTISLTVLLFLLVSLNLMQFYQHTRWIFPPYTITGEIYRDSFFTFRQKARVYIPEESIHSIISRFNNMEADQGSAWMNVQTFTDSEKFSGNRSSMTDKKIPYSVGLETRMDSLFASNNRLIRIRAQALTPKEVTDATLVVDYQVDGVSRSYNQFILEKFVPVGKWIPVACAWYVPRELPPSATVKVYFFNPSLLYPFYVDDLKIDFISLKDEPDYRKLEGVLLPEKVK